MPYRFCKKKKLVRDLVRHYEEAFARIVISKEILEIRSHSVRNLKLTLKP